MGGQTKQMKKKKNLFMLACTIIILVYFFENLLAPKTFDRLLKRMRKNAKRKKNSALKDFPVDIFVNTKKSPSRTTYDKSQDTKHSPTVVNKETLSLGHKIKTEKEYGAMGSAVK